MEIRNISLDTTFTHRSFELQGSQSLFAQAWTPTEELRGSIGIVHGLGEHSSRYAAWAERLVEAGFRVLAFDQRGHGRTAGQRGDAPSYDVLLDDLETMLDEMEASDPSLPRFLFGQSFGGNLVLNLALRRKPSVQGVIASSPLLLPTCPPPAWKKHVGRCLQHLWPTFQFRTGISAADLSHDRSVVDAYQSDRLVHGVVSARLAVAMLENGRWALGRAADLAIPSLLMHGTADSITSVDATIDFAKRAGTSCSLRTFSGLRHELHRESERDDVFNEVVEWLNSNLSD